MVIPVLLCGGVGKRLWPLSTPENPKPFLRLGHKHSLFQQTLLRCRAPIFNPVPIIVGNRLNISTVNEQLDELGAKAEVLWEPIGRNSCAAIAVACFQALKRSRDPVLFIQACDHLIEPQDEFILSIEAAVVFARNRLITFGIKADKPETGFGYIRQGKLIDRVESCHCYHVDEFIEKPNIEAAVRYCADGYYWNSGNFLINANLFLSELKILQPDLYENVFKAFNRSDASKMRRAFDEEDYEKIQSISVDHGVFQNTQKAAVLEVAYAWRDLGNWAAIADILKATNNKPELLTGTGFRDSNFDYQSELDDRQNEKRPWGEFDRLARGKGYQVKRLEVDPGQTLSLQSHRHRSEHWVIISGKAEITLEGSVEDFFPDQSIHIPKGAVHRISNKESDQLVLIEVQIGEYLEEDDIIRFEDVYDRHSTDN